MKVSLLLHPLLFSTAAGWVLECNSRITLPPGPADMTFTAAESVYNSLSALCGQYEAGLGYECSDAGHLTAFPPGTLISPEVLGGISPLFRAQQATNYLAHACESHCWCSDVQEFEEGLPLQCSQNDQSVPVAYPYPDVQCNAPQYRDSSKPSGVVCTGAVYGSPIVDDCNLANARVGLIDGNARKVYQFLDDRGTSTNPTGDQIVQTPRAFSSGHCSISVVLGGTLKGMSASRPPELENWAYIWGRVDSIIRNCVTSKGVGGWATAGQTAGDIAVIVSATNSRFETLFKDRMVCVTDTDGTAECQADGSVTGSTTSNQGSGSDASLASSRKRKCRGSCSEASDCSLDDDCLCASAKGIPLSSTWGTFACTFVPNAAAVVAAAVQYGSNCRDRCLLDANGTLEIAATIDTVDTNPTVPDLVCPCNCTYVSYACCLSPTGIVLEDLGEKIETTIQPPNGTVCCDGRTGGWAVGPSAGNPACGASSGNITARGDVGKRGARKRTGTHQLNDMPAVEVRRS